MKILWVNPNFLHPTTKGGQIRTLEMIKRLHHRHEIHYAAIRDPKHPEGVERAAEYSTKAFAFDHFVVPKNSPRFALQLVSGLFSKLPLAVSRYYVPEMAAFISQALNGGEYDRIVCDFLAPAPNFPSLGKAILYQHNVETIIWQRRVEQAGDPFRKAYLALQASRMRAYEKHCCQTAGHTVAVSDIDADLMQKMFGARNVSTIPTGVDLDYFRPRPSEPKADIVFVGSMDWMPNMDGAGWFLREVLPLIRNHMPEATVAMVGRDPGPELLQAAGTDPKLIVTGTVPDVRPWLWGAKLSIVPLRIGGGTRLKIYEAMAARLPVVSTKIGAEGLPLQNGDHILLADEPNVFAAQCITLLRNSARRDNLSTSAWNFIASRFSWEQVVGTFETILEQAPSAR